MLVWVLGGIAGGLILLHFFKGSSSTSAPVSNLSAPTPPSYSVITPTGISSLPSTDVMIPQSGYFGSGGTPDGYTSSSTGSPSSTVSNNPPTVSTVNNPPTNPPPVTNPPTNPPPVINPPPGGRGVCDPTIHNSCNTSTNTFYKRGYTPPPTYVPPVFSFPLGF